MKLVSDAFLDAVKRPNTFVRRVDVWSNGQLIYRDLPVSDGQVTRDRTAAVMGRCTLTIGGPDWPPRLVTDLLSPFGNELRVWRGVRLSTGDELVSQGVFKIDTVQTTDPDLSIAITAYDRAKAVQEANFEAPYTIPAGMNYADAIQQLIDDGVSGLTYNFTTTTHLTPLLVFPDGTDGERWQNAQQMATSIGCELFFDGDGACVLRDEPTVDRTPVLEVTDGAGGALISAPTQWTRQGAYNAVIVTSSAADVNPPVHVVVRDENPNSPTYYFGKFGKKPRRYASPFVTTGDQGISAGTSILAREQGIVQTITLTVAPNAAIEPGDVIRVQRKQLGIDQVNIIDVITLGLTADVVQTLGVRARNVT